MNEKWLSIWRSRLVRLGTRMAAAAVRPAGGDEMWKRRAALFGPDDADYRRELQDLDAIRVRFPDHA